MSNGAASRNPLTADGGCFLFLAGIALVILASAIWIVAFGWSAHLNAVVK